MAPASVKTAISLAIRQATASTDVPQAPPAAGAWGSDRNDGFNPAAIIGIVAAIVIIVTLIPLLAVLLRRYESRRCREVLPDTASSRGLESSKSSVREDQSLKSIIVTKEVQRSSLKVDPGLKKPEEVHPHQRGWSRTEVHGGNW